MSVEKVNTHFYDVLPVMRARSDYVEVNDFYLVWSFFIANNHIRPIMII